MGAASRHSRAHSPALSSVTLRIRAPVTNVEPGSPRTLNASNGLLLWNNLSALQELNPMPRKSKSKSRKPRETIDLTARKFLASGTRIGILPSCSVAVAIAAMRGILRSHCSIIARKANVSCKRWLSSSVVSRYHEDGYLAPVQVLCPSETEELRAGESHNQCDYV